MKRTNLILIYLLSITILGVGCKQAGNISSSGFSISGEVEGLRDRPVYLEKIGFGSTNESINEVKAENGKFTISLPQNPGPGYFRVRTGRNAVDLILDGKEHNINISGKYRKFNSSAVKLQGSELTEKYNSILKNNGSGKKYFI